MSNQTHSRQHNPTTKVNKFINDSTESTSLEIYDDYLLIVKDSSKRLIELFEQCKRKFLPSIPLEHVDENSYEILPPAEVEEIIVKPEIEETLLVPFIKIEPEDDEDEKDTYNNLTPEEQRFIDKNIRNAKGQYSKSSAICRICQKRGNSRPVIRSHIKKVHMNKKWKMSKLDLWRRKKINEGKIDSKNYRCVICPYSEVVYDSREALRAHLMEHSKHDSFKELYNEDVREQLSMASFSYANFDHPFGFLISQ
jgi:hypothetical protein